MRNQILVLAIVLTALAAGCAKAPREEAKAIMFKDDIAFLKQHTQAVVLTDEAGLAQAAVAPDLQGRVLTSTAGGPDGASFGWINRELLASGQNNVHMNAFGGEDRFWIGPEGGQFSIFFKKDAPFNLDNWFTPPPINEGAFDIASKEKARIAFKKAIHLVNYSGAEFDLSVDREVRLLTGEDVRSLGLPLPEGVKTVAFASDNRITNTWKKPWAKDTGLLSVWILGMFNPSPSTTIVVPFKPGPEAELGPKAHDTYFGKIPADRLAYGDGVLFFSGDGKFRSKLGISPRRVKPFAGSWDEASGVLTLIHLTVPEGATDYVNSMWEIQKDPFGGDVVNSYNDGPASPGAKPLGPFYELESSSPAAALKPGETLAHVHTTMHFQGPKPALESIARAALGVGLDEIAAAFKKK